MVRLQNNMCSRTKYPCLKYTTQFIECAPALAILSGPKRYLFFYLSKNKIYVANWG